MAVTGYANLNYSVPQNGALPAIGNTNLSLSNAAAVGLVQQVALTTTLATIPVPSAANTMMIIIPDGTHNVYLGGTPGAAVGANSILADGTQSYIGPIPLASAHQVILGASAASTVTIVWI